jgi:G3E family GTPase
VASSTNTSGPHRSRGQDPWPSCGTPQVNDFGAVNIDAELVVGVDDGVISLANGCVCCQIRDDLTKSVTALLARPEAVEYIVLEASGVAAPPGSS